jgi:hypothetical protein
LRAIYRLGGDAHGVLAVRRARITKRLRGAGRTMPQRRRDGVGSIAQ